MCTRERNNDLLDNQGKDIQTNGFLIMDTNCFLKYNSEQKKERARFDNNEVKVIIRENNFMLVTTSFGSNWQEISSRWERAQTTR